MCHLLGLWSRSRSSHSWSFLVTSPQSNYQLVHWRIELSRCPRSCGYVYTENKKEKLHKAEPVPSFVVEDEDEENDLVDNSDWYFPGMEINFTWFDDEDVLKPPPSYE